MDFLEDLFDLGDRKRRRRGDGHYEDQHEHGHDDYYEDEHHDNEHGYNGNPQRQGVFCPYCSAQVAAPGSKFCQNCGGTLNAILNCSGCGAKIAANASFCTECGKKLK
jgi:RecJ-like exonuclease